MIVWGRQNRRYQQASLGPSQAVFFNDLGSGGQPPQPPVQPVTSQAGGSGKARNEIIEIEGKRWVVPKDRVAEFLAQFDPKPAQNVEIQTVRNGEIDLRPVSFTTQSGRTVTTTQQVLKDELGVILVMCALVDEDFYE
jgi:hypothetical protein